MYAYGLCSVNWGSVPEYLVAATGTAAIFVAAVQLKALNRSERIKNTLKLLDDFYRPVDISGDIFSPMNAFSKLQEVASTNEFDVVREKINRGAQITKYELKLFRSARSAGTILANYFTMIKGLLDRKVVDEVLILEKIGTFAYNGLPTIKEVAHPSWDLKDAQYLAKRAMEIAPPLEQEKLPSDIITVQES